MAGIAVEVLRLWAGLLLGGRGAGAAAARADAVAGGLAAMGLTTQQHTLVCGRTVLCLYGKTAVVYCCIALLWSHTASCENHAGTSDKSGDHKCGNSPVGSSSSHRHA